MPDSGADLKPALSASLRFVPLAPGGAADAGLIAPRMPFAIEVTVAGAGGSPAPAGVGLWGWLRRTDPGNAQCADAAEAFLRTGRLPTGAVFLNDPILAVVTEDDAVALVDPEFSLASADILAAHRLSGRPAAITVDETLRRFLLPLPDRGSVVAIDAGGAMIELASGIGRPVAVAPDGADGVLVLDAGAGRLLHLAGGKVRPLDVLAGPIDGLAAGPAGTAAVWGTSGAALIDAREGRVLASAPGAAPLSAAVLGDPSGAPSLIAGTEAGLSIVWSDAPESVQTVPLPIRPAALATSADGRFALAHDPAGGPVAVVDIGRGRVVQVSGADDVAVAQVLVDEFSAYLMLADQSRVGVLDLRALAGERVAEFREVPLGQSRETPLVAGGLMTSLAPSGGVLAVHARSHQGFRIERADAMGNAPPMTAAPLRGGVPRLVAALDRSFREGRPGFLSTVASLPGPGRWELVATTGLGRLSFCADVPVAEPWDPDAARAGRLDRLSSEDRLALRLRLVDAEGRPVAASGALVFADLAGAWRERVPFESGTDGLSRAIYDLPEASGPIVVTLDAPAARLEVAPLLLEGGDTDAPDRP